MAAFFFIVFFFAQMACECVIFHIAHWYDAAALDKEDVRNEKRHVG